MTKAPTPTEKPKKLRDGTKNKKAVLVPHFSDFFLFFISF